MLRASLALLLLAASAVAFAQNGRGLANGNVDTCPEIADRAVAERQVDAVPVASDPVALARMPPAPSTACRQPWRPSLRGAVATTTTPRYRATAGPSGTASCRACSAEADVGTP